MLVLRFLNSQPVEYLKKYEIRRERESELEYRLRVMQKYIPITRDSKFILEYLKEGSTCKILDKLPCIIFKEYPSYLNEYLSTYSLKYLVRMVYHVNTVNTFWSLKIQNKLIKYLYDKDVVDQFNIRIRRHFLGEAMNRKDYDLFREIIKDGRFYDDIIIRESVTLNTVDFLVILIEEENIININTETSEEKELLEKALEKTGKLKKYYF